MDSEVAGRRVLVAISGSWPCKSRASLPPGFCEINFTELMLRWLVGTLERSFVLCEPGPSLTGSTLMGNVISSFWPFFSRSKKDFDCDTCDLSSLARLIF